MGAKRLARRHVERVWGRDDLAGEFAPPPALHGQRIGEIWFEGAPADPLLVKYLFTTERLSIQVHPDDRAAAERGYPRGKDEAWYVLSAEQGATIGLGLRRSVSVEALRSAALDGSIEQLLDWRPVTEGEVFYSPAGTIHAIGGGLSLIEVQQNLDLTYRLYDYGRPRELHLDEALAVAHPAPWPEPPAPTNSGAGRSVLAEGAAFALERWRGPWRAQLAPGSVLVPLGGAGTVDGQPLEAASVWAAEGAVAIEGAADLLVAIPSEQSA